MNIRTTASLAVIGFATIAASSQQASAAPMVIDDFESYSNLQLLASSASSTPYLRFGVAVADNFVATQDPSFVIDGTTSGRIPLNWAGGNNASVRRNFTTGNRQDFSSYDFLTVQIRSTNASTVATAALSFTDGTTIYQTSAPLAISGTAETYTFNLDLDSLALVDGSASLESTLANVSAIGFRFASSAGTGSETIVIDNITLDNVPIPEPATLGLLGMTGAGLLVRRRRS